MKKVLAAILAVAMAASMSAVAFAKDYQYDSDRDDWATINLGGGSANNGDATIPMGKEKSFRVRAAETDVTPQLSTGELAFYMSEGYLSADVIVTSGKANLASNPSLKVVDDEAIMKIKFKDTWGVDDKDAKVKTRFTAKKDITDPRDPERYTLSFKNEVGDTYYVKDASKTTWDEFYGAEAEAAELTAAEVAKAKAFIKKEQVSPKGGSINKEVKVYDGTVMLKKGDTITSSEFTITGTYYEVSNYGETMTITPTEVSDRYVVAKGEELYDNSGSGDKVIMYFGTTGEVASVEFKISSAQKDMNLGYNTDEIEEVTDAYPSVDFEFLRFNTYQNANTNVLTNTGTMTFNAIGGKNTTIYEWDGKTLTEKNSKYNSYDDTVTVEGIKRLTCYVVADQKLEAKVEETEAPPATETNTPVTEPVTAPEPSAPADNNENPNTGAL